LGCRQSPLQRFRGIPAAARGLSGDKTLGLAADGLEGWGEPAVEGRADTVVAAVTELGCYLRGQDPDQIEDIWQVLCRGGFYRGGPVLMSAIAGIDQALWDLQGKRYRLSIH